MRIVLDEINPIYKALKNYKVNKPCLKQSVKALIITDDLQYIYGSNHVNEDIKECPRVIQGCKTGEGYNLCKSVCNQKHHAEVDAINNAQSQNIDINGASLYLINHTYCCNNCLNVMKQNGIKHIYVLNEDGVVKEYHN